MKAVIQDESPGYPADLLKETIDALPDHIAVLNSEGRIVAVNKRWSKFAQKENLGYEHYGVGQNYLEVCDKAQGFGSEIARLVGRKIRELIFTQRGTFRVEYDCHSPREERWFQLCGSVCHYNNALFIVLAHQNITPLMIAERRLRESEERYRALLELSPFGVIVHQEERIAYANGTAMRLARVEGEADFMNREIYDFLVPTDKEQVQDKVQRVLLGDRPGPSEAILLRADGSEVPIEFQAVLIQWRGRPAIQVILQDITERKRQQSDMLWHKAKLEETIEERTAKLRETVEELEHFSYALIHDLRAPLRAITSYSDFIALESSTDPARAHEYLLKIQQSALRMDHLITDALNYSKILRHEFPTQAVPLGTLIQGLLESYPEFQRHGENIKVAKDFPWVLGNESALTECFSNLLRNAIKFVPPEREPKVVVRWENRNDMIRVWVEDNGIGIPRESRESIFSMFQRLNKPEDYPGTGIGLAIVKKAVERIGGRVGVESEVGKGSRFWVEFPACRPPGRKRPNSACVHGKRCIA